MTTSEIRLTQFSPGAGCGCKISPADLAVIIKQVPDYASFERLLVGCETRDDAAVYDLGNGQAVISTTDFFTPIVDDPFDFGRIAAANAISDVYAMGGRPLLAISVLGWPLAKLSAAMAAMVVEGAAAICRKAGIPLAGGHSIDISDPVFGLAVTGIIRTQHVKKNSTAKPGCRLFLTKPLGTGILSTAAKKDLLQEKDYRGAVAWMTRLNEVGAQLGPMQCVSAMTDVTGFGLLGHLLEICEGSGCSATLHFGAVPVLDHVYYYIERNCIPGGTRRNWKSYGDRIGMITDMQRMILADPQTSGGLLIAADPEAADFDAIVAMDGMKEIGILEETRDKVRIRIVD